MSAAKQTRPKTHIRAHGLPPFLAFLAVAALIGSGVYLLVHHEEDAARTELAQEIAAYGPRKGVPKTIDDLKKAIAAYEKQIERHVADAAQTASYWKILGTRFRAKNMHKEAMDAFLHAENYTPDDAQLHYLYGLSAAEAGKSLYDAGSRSGEQTRLFNEAERAYKRALELEPDYAQARYGLAILYAYQMNRPEDALSEGEKYLALRPTDADAMFVMGRAAFMTGAYNRAIDWYNKGISNTKNETQKQEARQNIDYIKSVM